MKIPFSILPASALERLSKKILGMGKSLKPFFPLLEMNLKESQAEYNSTEYLSMCAVSSFFSFIILLIIIFLVLFSLKIQNAVFISIIAAIPITLFIFSEQTLYPKLHASMNIKDIERNLLPALRAILIHLTSGIPLYEVFVSISNGPYGALSKEFKKIVKKINSGTPAVNAIEESAARNPSLYYRRAVWQLVNGLKAGGDVAIVLREIIDGISKEQIIQIENYGSQLNPLAMFYMLIAVIIPSLSITLIVVLASFLSLQEFTVKLVFGALYLVVIFFQIMFLGIIKTRRPNLINL